MAISRIFWFVLVIAAANLGVYWSIGVSTECKKSFEHIIRIKEFLPHIQAYNDWQAHPTVTTVQTTGKPISEITFPAITICGHGSIDEVREITIIARVKT